MESATGSDDGLPCPTTLRQAGRRLAQRLQADAAPLEAQSIKKSKVQYAVAACSYIPADAKSVDAVGTELVSIAWPTSMDTPSVQPLPSSGCTDLGTECESRNY